MAAWNHEHNSTVQNVVGWKATVYLCAYIRLKAVCSGLCLGLVQNHSGKYRKSNSSRCRQVQGQRLHPKSKVCFILYFKLKYYWEMEKYYQRQKCFLQTHQINSPTAVFLTIYELSSMLDLSCPDRPFYSHMPNYLTSQHSF